MFTASSTKKLDLVFILGAAGASAPEDFLLQKEIAKEIIKAQPVSVDGVRVGAVVYGINARRHMPFSASLDKNHVLRNFDDIRVDNYGDNLKQGLDVAGNMLFRDRNGAEQNVPKIAVVFYNMPLNSDAIDTAKNLRDKQIQLISIGIGENVQLSDGNRLTAGHETSVVAKSIQDSKHVARNFSVILKSALCSRMKCENFAMCMLELTKRCICPLCQADEIVKPICGTDGITYASECRLQAQSCKTQKSLAVAKSAPCGTFQIAVIICNFTMLCN